MRYCFLKSSILVLTPSADTPQYTHLRRFAFDSTSKFHVESSPRFHRFWKENPGGNYNIDSTWKFRRGFDFKNRRNIAEISTWIFLCRFEVESTKLLYSLFPFFHFLSFSALKTYSKLIWLNLTVLTQSNFNDIDIITDIGTTGTTSFGNFATTQIIMNKDNFYLLQNNTNKNYNANVYKPKIIHIFFKIALTKVSNATIYMCKQLYISSKTILNKRFLLFKTQGLYCLELIFCKWVNLQQPRY